MLFHVFFFFFLGGGGLSCLVNFQGAIFFEAVLPRCLSCLTPYFYDFTYIIYFRPWSVGGSSY